MRATRFTGRLVAVTGSVGKTTTKEMLRTDPGRVRPHACRGRLLQQPLGPAADPGAHAARTAAFCVAEIGMNHAGEIAPLARLARPHVAVITAVEKAHIGYSARIEAIADEKAAILRGAGARRRRRAARRFAAAAAAARGRGCGARRDLRRRRRPPMCGWSSSRSDADGSDVVADVAGRTASRFRLNAPGRHMAMNALAALAAARHLAHVDPAAGAACAGRLRAGRGPRRAPADRAARRHRAAAGRKLQRQPRLDARGARGAAPAAGAAPHRRAGRHAGTRRAGPAEHARSPPTSRAAADLPVRLRAADAANCSTRCRRRSAAPTRRIPPRWRRSSRAPSRPATRSWSRAASAAA